MKMPSSNHRGSILINVLAVICCLGFLAVFLLPGNRCHSRAPRITCANNLRQIGMGFRMFSEDHNDLFPNEVPENKGGSMRIADARHTFRHFRAAVSYIGSPRVLFCPTDEERKRASGTNIFSNENLSYFAVLNATASLPGMMLAGDRNLTRNGIPLPSAIYSISTNNQIGWSKTMHKENGNLLLVDGSVQQASSSRLNQQLGISETNYLVSVP